MAVKLNCCVPFCARVRGLRKGDNGVLPREWICQTHWMGVPRKMRRAKHRASREATAAQVANADLSEINRTASRCRRIWNRVKRAAIERAGGIA